jgi:hypothetical protein
MYGLCLDRRLLKYVEGVNIKKIKKIDSPPRPLPCLTGGRRKGRGEVGEFPFHKEHGR